jgi:hypothetical protein
MLLIASGQPGLTSDQRLKMATKEIRAIKDELFKICWFMRGSLSVEQAYMTDFDDRDSMIKLIESNLETAGKTKMPFF